MRALVAGLILIFQPALALACGGFFCNASQPVVQSAERILFVPHEGRMHMHVQIQYGGPPERFGWILPTSPGVEVKLSTEAVFSSLDTNYQPIFTIQQIFDDACSPRFAPTALDSAFAESADGGGGVAVLSRQAVGPYDNAILQAQSVQDLRDWLDENNFQIPPEMDEKLGPYVEIGAHFVVVKLRAGQTSGDIAPLYMNFPGEFPAIPIRPTSVAADPDMGILVHILGEKRAIPVNYYHVRINEAALDLNNFGQNYVDVVGQAVDEAGGRAFVTDFAGEVNDGFRNDIEPISLSDLADLVTAQDVVNHSLWNDADFQREVKATVALPEEVAADSYWDCIAPRFFGGPFAEPIFEDGGPINENHRCGVDPRSLNVDMDALTARITQNINPAREHLTEMVAAYPYLTRLYSTMSPFEMTIDPLFDFNGDLPPVSNQRTLTIRIPCEREVGNGPDAFFTPARDRAVMTTTAGDNVAVDLSGDAAISRSEGITQSGLASYGAAVIERMYVAGEPERVGGMGERPDFTPGGMAMAEVVSEADTGECPNGGVVLRVGIDHDGDGQLDEVEITGSEVICNGRDGTNGADGSNGRDGEQGEMGQQGPSGAQGPAGSQGEAGAQGETGAQGASGEQGEQGEPGEQGPEGMPGLDGSPGAAGPAGEPGRDGARGTSDQSCRITQNDDGTYTLNCPDSMPVTLRAADDASSACRVDENADGTYSIQCGDQPEVTLPSPAPATSSDSGCSVGHKGSPPWALVSLFVFAMAIRRRR